MSAAGRARLRRLAVALALGASALGCGAQNLGELVEAARGYDAALLGARATLEAARWRVAQARGAKLPTVTLQLSSARSLGTSPDTGSNLTSTATNQATAGLSGSQPLFNRVDDIAIVQAERAAESSAADLEVTAQDLIVRVAQAYFDVLAAADNLATAQASRAAITEQVASAQRNFEVGTATITDTREAQARLDLARSTQIQAENTLVTSRIALDTLVGRTNVAPRPLALPLASAPLEPATAEGWVAAADADHPLIRRARLALEVARLDIDKARAGHLPTVALTANVGRGYQATAGNFSQIGLANGLSVTERGPSTSSSVGVTVNIPLFSGFQVQNRVRETLSLEDRAQDDLQAQRRSVSQNTRTAFYALRSGAAQVDALEAAEGSSRLALEATQLGYSVGVRVNIDVLNAQSQLFTTRAQLAKARYDRIMADLRLRQAAGNVSERDVARVDTLLAR